MKIISTLLHHQWLSFWRSRGSGKNFALQIVLGIFLLYFLGIAIFLGIAMPDILQKFSPHRDPITEFTRFVLYYFFIDLFFRFMVQELPVLSIESYLTKNIQRKYLLRFLNLRSLFHFLNIVPLLIFLPFSFSTILQQYGWGATAGFDVSIVSLILFNQYLAAYIKRKSILKTSWFLGMFLGIALLGFLDFRHIISIRSASSWIFMHLLAHPWSCIVPIVLVIVVYMINNRYLYNNLYLDELSKKQKNVKTSTGYNWLNKYGEIGDLISLELKLITRNKRPKNVLSISFIFLAYGFLFFKVDILEKGDLGSALFGAFFVTGMFAMTYSNFLFAWQSSHFDGLLTSKIQIKDYIKSKVYFLYVAETTAFILSTLYGIIHWKFILIELGAYLFNIGVNTILMAYISTYNYKYIDITQKAAFNYSGTGMVQWIYALIIMILPALIYAPIAYLVSSWAGIATLGIIGAVCFLFQNYWISLLTTNFNKRKYLIAEGFREK
ncbi:MULTISPECIES: DUF5687 family protein [Chitinophagaceae]